MTYLPDAETIGWLPAGEQVQNRNRRWPKEAYNPLIRIIQIPVVVPGLGCIGVLVCAPSMVAARQSRKIPLTFRNPLFPLCFAERNFVAAPTFVALGLMTLNRGH